MNDIAAVSPMNNLLVKYADDITMCVPVRQSTDTAAAEVENISGRCYELGDPYPQYAIQSSILGYANSVDILKINSIIFFNSLVMSVFLYGIEVWGAAYKRKYLDRIDRFLKRPYMYRFGFTTKKTTILDLKLKIATLCPLGT